jgi:aspartyl-tRNA(Asn)/glutamyl-tRNA(Gln) amidotransferase subunit B
MTQYAWQKTWDAVIGLEIHVQLKTASKIFSGSATTFGAQPNHQASAVDLGLPGTLPVLNHKALELALRFGLSIGADIPQTTFFARKNYFYPDLPKGYQISQLDHPVVGRGQMTFEHQGQLITLNITRAHLEEDAGKSIHDLVPYQTGIDLNRAGMPLLEIVTEPELSTPEEASGFFKHLHQLVTFLDMCDGQLAQGSMRCDANVSIKPKGEKQLGTRVEIKNINSFRFLEQAIAYEIERQIECIETQERIAQETRLFDPEQQVTRSMRSKETSQDYRYFPDPDLLPVHIDQALLDKIRAELPELPSAKKARYTQVFQLSADDADQLLQSQDLWPFFETAATPENAKLTANWLLGAIQAKLNESNLTLSHCKFRPQHLQALIKRIQDGTLSSKTAKEAFDQYWLNPTQDLDQLIDQAGLRQVSDTGFLEGIIQEILTNNPTHVSDYLKADESKRKKMLGFFVGQIMKASQGKANPQQLNALLMEALAAFEG